MNTKNQWAMASNLVAGLAMAGISIRFNSAHFTYVLIVFAIFLAFFYWKKRPLALPMAGIRPMCWGLLLFYGLNFLTALPAWDTGSMRMAAEYAGMAIPFFMMYFLRGHFPVDAGIRWGIAVGGIVSCAFGLYQLFVLHMDRILSFSAHANSFGTNLFMLITMSGYYLCRARGVSRLAWAVLLFLEGFCLYHSGSRGATFGLLGGLVLAGLLMLWQRRKEIGKRAILSFFFSIVVAFSLGYGYMHWSENAGRSAGERGIMLEASLHMWEDHKLLGVGLANWQTNYYSDTYHPATGREQGLDMPHNMPAYFLSTAGVVGLFGYLAFWFLSLYSLYKAKASQVDKALLFAACVIFFAFTLQGLVDTTIINKIPAKIYFALMGYVFACCLPGQPDFRGDKNESITGRPA